jgi:hypothetical protein
MRHKPVYWPGTYVQFIREARKQQPYEVKYLSYDFFKDFSKVLHFHSARQPGYYYLLLLLSLLLFGQVTDIKVIKYLPSDDIQVKLNFSDEAFQCLPRNARLHACSPVVEIPHLYQSRLPVKKSKYEHLQQLKGVVLPEFHDFYDNFPR